MIDGTEKSASDARVETVLAALRTAAAEDGLEQRILQRLAAGAGASTGPARARWLRPSRVLPAVLVLCTACTVAVLFLGRVASSPASPAKTDQSRTQLRPDTVAAPDVLPAGERTRHMRSGPDNRTEVCTTCGDPRRSRGTEPAAIGSPLTRAPATGVTPVAFAREPSFPAPEMPLTEQEHLLLRIAHRNDPIQVAMLDMAERTRELSREHAETARFFAPAPLPPELQHQINAALRSQYVNTPPPPELASQTADRSTP